ncbi:MAG: biotin carboxylase N-terminal domain-containing protein [Bacteroidales bacterium]
MNNNKFHKILVANRGEIALRIIRAIKKSGMKSVAIYSKTDRNLPYVQQADESWPLNGDTLAGSYLNQQMIIDIALHTGSSAIHPGYGFLSENAGFARRCRENGIAFIGPTPELIDLMGNKANAITTAKKLDVPVIEGMTGSPEDILEHSENLQYPLLVKPAAGGGGKGMRIVRKKSELKESMVDGAREAENYFGSGELYVERYIQRARHIEVQVLADNHGNAVHLYERECTLQRRYQKIIEEAPSPSITENTREKITSCALRLALGIGYTSAGTVEFLVDEMENFFFIEMNTRIQVEHPVTEMITGLDLVREQICIAGGSKLSIQQSDVKISGHAIESRLYAEDPGNEFMPVTGTLNRINTDQVNIRMDNGFNEGNTISPFYDPMISKLIAHGSDRKDAIRQLISGLKAYHISGVTTNRDFLVALLLSKDFVTNKVHTKYIDENLDRLLKQLSAEREHIDPGVLLSMFTVAATEHRYPSETPDSVWQELGHWRQLRSIQIHFNGQDIHIPYRFNAASRSYETMIDNNPLKTVILDHTGNFYKLMIDGKQYQCWADVNGNDITLNVEQYNFKAWRIDIPDDKNKGIAATGANNDSNEVFAPLNGKVVKINAKEGDQISEGDTLLVIESMKMENRIISPKEAAVGKILVNTGDLVELNELLILLK